MSSFETFWWGLGGAALGYFGVNVLPILTSKAQGKSVNVHCGWLVAAMFVYILAGGFVAMLIGGAAEPKHAASYGMGWYTLVKGGGEAIRLVGNVAEK